MPLRLFCDEDSEVSRCSCSNDDGIPHLRVDHRLQVSDCCVALPAVQGDDRFGSVRERAGASVSAQLARLLRKWLRSSSVSDAGTEEGSPARELTPTGPRTPFKTIYGQDVERSL